MNSDSDSSDDDETSHPVVWKRARRERNDSATTTNDDTADSGNNSNYDTSLSNKTDEHHRPLFGNISLDDYISSRRGLLLSSNFINNHSNPKAQRNALMTNNSSRRDASSILLGWSNNAGNNNNTRVINVGGGNNNHVAPKPWTREERILSVARNPSAKEENFPPPVLTVRVPKTSSTCSSVVVAPKTWRRAGDAYNNPDSCTIISANTTTNVDLNKSLDDVIRDRKIERPAIADIYGKKDGKLPLAWERLIGRSDNEIIVGGSPDSGMGASPLTPAINPLTDVVHTPYEAVKFLANCGFLVKVKIGRLSDEDESSSTTEGKKADQLWRCEVSSGIVKGACNSERKVIAREVACREFLLQLKRKYRKGRIPRYHLPDQLLFETNVLSEVGVLAKEQGLDVCHQTYCSTAGMFFGSEAPWYVCNYTVGGEMFVGEDELKENAEKRAALKLYEKLAGKPFPQIKYFVGDDCLSDLKHDTLTETEILEVPLEVVDLEAHFKRLANELNLYEPYSDDDEDETNVVKEEEEVKLPSQLLHHDASGGITPEMTEHETLKRQMDEERIKNRCLTAYGFYIPIDLFASGTELYSKKYEFVLGVKPLLHDS